MLANMATSLIIHERIQTTTPKAKELRTVVEPLITLGKKGGIGNRQRAARTVKDPEALEKLFAELAERYEDREGGYTRVIKVMRRRGDNAPIAIIELVDSEEALVEEGVFDGPADAADEEEELVVEAEEPVDEEDSDDEDEEK
jgi:large subunit ribosomal protein L17